MTYMEEFKDKLSLNYDVPKGMLIYDAIEDAILLHIETGIPVRFVFNTTEYLIDKNTMLNFYNDIERKGKG